MADTEESDWTEVQRSKSSRRRIRSEVGSPMSSVSRSLPYSPSCFIPEHHVKRKPDLMRKAKEMRAQWEKFSFLSNDAREGRKFNLADRLHSYNPDFQPQRKGVKFAYNTYIPPNEKRRDRLRFSVRLQMMKGRTDIASAR